MLCVLPTDTKIQLDLRLWARRPKHWPDGRLYSILQQIHTQVTEDWQLQRHSFAQQYPLDSPSYESSVIVYSCLPPHPPPRILRDMQQQGQEKGAQTREIAQQVGNACLEEYHRRLWEAIASSLVLEALSPGLASHVIQHAQVPRSTIVLLDLTSLVGPGNHDRL